MLFVRLAVMIAVVFLALASSALAAHKPHFVKPCPGQIQHYNTHRIV